MRNDNPYHDQGMWKGAKPSTFAKAALLRNQMTEAETVLWNILKNKFEGYKFRRQHPISHFVADFYCHALKLIIEVDGEYHNDKIQQQKDLNRTAVLNSNKVKVIRFTNQEVLNDIDLVKSKIIEEISK